ncbi:hypothetical protein EIP91_012246 [Steccherinum ochraceum]|uniref:Uncharacterized protein n=1 Tax=Steccherinum ochraceum TaxID=92696 RepID=A0A4R0RQ98_9APHY|nr:hypothetical protein EIP91_012246 [Steccherinum ochraceum]
MSSFSLNTPGLSFYSIPLVWLVGIWPSRVRNALIDRSVPRGFDTVQQPLSNVGRLHEYPGVKPETAEEVDRAEGAHKNALEMMPLWIGAVSVQLAGNQAGLDDSFMNAASFAFIGARVLYNYIYLRQSNRAESAYRSYAWLASLAIPMTIFIRAANKIRLSRSA